MEIKQAAIHGILKAKDTSGEGSAQLQLREKLLPTDDMLTKLAEDVLKLYGRVANGYGTLGAEAVDVFALQLKQFSSGATDFLAFTQVTTKSIAIEMQKQHFATTSYPVFLSYENQGRTWVIVALLKLKNGIGMDEKTLELTPSRILDVTDLREAARIDLEKWRNDEQPYLSFIKRASGKDSETSQFFRSALGCKDYTDAKHNTDQAATALVEYYKSKGWEPDRAQRAREDFYNYCRARKDSGEPVNLVALSAIINDQEPDSFREFVRENNYTVSDTFAPHPDTYGKFRRIRKKFGTITVGFDISDLSEGRIMVDENGSIVIVEPPQDLVNEMKEAQGERD